MQTLSVSKLTSKGQATIPGRVRQKLGLKSGDSVAFKLKHGQIFLQKARPVDRVFASAVEETLKDEWHSEHDERAYADL
ncbi:MAG: hypothetical protein JNK23_19075 [Opitutaceae bacterium]|nr:hypothetical protein [Opitutaceae bacterium]